MTDEIETTEKKKRKKLLVMIVLKAVLMGIVAAVEARGRSKS